MKALKAYNTEAISRFPQRKVHNTEIVETPQDDPPATEFRQPLQVQIHLEMSGILVQLGHIQRT